MSGAWFYQPLLPVSADAQSSAYRNIIMADSPIGYWRLGETSGTLAVDEMSLYNGTYNNSPTLGVSGAISGDTNTAVTFSAVSDKHMAVPHNAVFSFGTGPFSLECWFKLNSAGVTLDWFMSKGSQFGLLIGTGAQSGLLLLDNFVDLAAQSTVTINQDAFWHHVVATRDVNTYKLYFDGADVTGTTTTRTFATNTQVMTFGMENDNFGELDGSLDECAIYGYALTATQVLTHYKAGAPLFPRSTLYPQILAH